MYFVDRYSPGGFPRGEQDLHAIVEAASQSTLEAIGWGLAYPDFWRLLSFGLPIPFTGDLGSGLGPGTSMAGPLQIHTTLRFNNGDRAYEKVGGQQLVFNATVGETGEQLLISPLNIASTGDTLEGS